MRDSVDLLTPSVEPRLRRADYGIDAPLTGLLPPAVLGLGLAALSAYHARQGRQTLASFELLSSGPPLFTAAIYFHATTRGKLRIWAELLDELSLRGDEY